MRYVRNYSAEMLVLGQLLPEIRTPVLIIAGRRDRIVPMSNAEFLVERLPAGKLAFIDAGHFTWEDATEEYGALVTSWRRGSHTAHGAAGGSRA